MSSTAVVRPLSWAYVVSGALAAVSAVAGAATFFVPNEGIGVATDQAFGHAADPSSNVVAVAAVPGFLVLAVLELVAFYFYIRELRRA